MKEISKDDTQDVYDIASDNMDSCVKLGWKHQAVFVFKTFESFGSTSLGFRKEEWVSEVGGEIRWKVKKA